MRGPAKPGIDETEPKNIGREAAMRVSKPVILSVLAAGALGAVT
jgi:hypothetical protein